MPLQKNLTHVTDSTGSPNAALTQKRVAFFFNLRHLTVCQAGAWRRRAERRQLIGVVARSSRARSNDAQHVAFGECRNIAGVVVRFRLVEVGFDSCQHAGNTWCRRMVDVALNRTHF